MNTTHTNEPTGQSAKQVAIQLGGEVLLRDYFAAKAMQTILPFYANSSGDLQDVADKAYAMADLMLKAREA